VTIIGFSVTEFRFGLNRDKLQARFAGGNKEIAAGAKGTPSSNADREFQCKDAENAGNERIGMGLAPVVRLQ
jgi:hypothetical protein